MSLKTILEDLKGRRTAEEDCSKRAMQRPEMTDHPRLLGEFDERLEYVTMPSEVYIELENQLDDLVHQRGMAAQTHRHI